MKNRGLTRCIVYVSAALLIAACCPANPPLNSAIAAHGNTDWHIDTAEEFLFGTDMAGTPTASNHCPATWTRRHLNVGLTNTNHFYYDADLTTPGDDTDATSGIETAMLFFHAGHGFPPPLWDTLGNRATQANMTLGDCPGGGQLRYYWQCSCTNFAHGPKCCSGMNCSTSHPCTGGYDWWYQCPGQFDGSADSANMRNVYERWGPVLGSDFRMACGSSTCAYCHQSQMNQIWNSYNNLGYDVADSFINGLRGSTVVVPLCITKGGANAAATPLYDAAFTNQANTSGTSHYHIQYLSYFASTPTSPAFIPVIPKLLPIYEVRPLPLPEPLLDVQFETEDDWMVSADQIGERGPRVRIDKGSGAVYVSGERKPSAEESVLEEQEYIDRALRFIREQGWTEKSFSEPMGVRFVIDTTPVKDTREVQKRLQKNVIVTLKRQIDVAGELVNVLGEGDVMAVQMNNDGSLLNASKVWREVASVRQQAQVKSYEEAYQEALGQIKDRQIYELDRWTWGYKEAAGDAEQSELRIVFQFWFAPADRDTLPAHPPQMIEVPGQVQ